MSQRPSQINRRGFLQIGALAGAGTLGACASTSSVGLAPLPSPRKRSRATNIIFMVADGMSTGTLSLADMVIRQRDARPSHWSSLWQTQGVRRAMCATHSRNSLVTDSAAAGSAWGCGVHINNGAINTTPGGGQPTPLLVSARDQGKATGLVTTTRLTDATPASFIANVAQRSQETEIARQILDRGVDIALGGGGARFASADLDQRPGLAVVRDASQLRSAPIDAPVLGLFADEHMSYEVDRPDSEPSLREMTESALTRLARAPGGFVVQIEGGRVDHAAHANDAVSLISDQLAFDDAVGSAMEFALARDDTLLIVTTDHANANPGLTVYGPKGAEGIERLSRGRQSFEWIQQQLAPASTPREMMGVLPMLVYQATGVELDDADRAWMHRHLVEHERADGFHAVSGLGPVLGAVLTNAFGVAFLSPNHTADLVEVSAFGPGSERLAPVIDNIDLHRLVIESLDLTPAPTRAGV